MKCTKLLITIILVVSLTAFFCFTVNAHGGNTDSKGGHYNYQTNEYHYHHGYPEHSHPNGECPYAIKETKKKEMHPIIKAIGCSISSLFIGYIFACIPTSIILLILFMIEYFSKKIKIPDNIFKILTGIFMLIIVPILFYGMWNA